MNYEQARQIGPDGPAPGKWNWTNMNDRVISTAWPCAYPDFEWPPFDLATIGTVTPTGRQRCDHDTQEEAERHHYEATIAGLDWRPIDSSVADYLQRCDFPGCTAWADGAVAWDHGWARGDFCGEHANAESYRAAHPFVPGAQVIHS